MSSLDGSVPISDYALIGDCHGVALVDKEGSIDWASLPRFDTGAYFCRLLDAEHGGHFRLRPRDLTRVERRYLDDTNVLETLFFTSGGSARLVDCLAMRRGGRDRPLKQLLRRVEGVQGEVTFEVEIAPRFDYASLHPWLRHHARERVYSAIGGDDGFVLSSEVELELDRGAASWSATFTVTPRQRRRFALSATNAHAPELTRVPSRVFDRRIDDTIEWWRRWVRGGKHIESRYRDAVVRSSLALKLLNCAPTGAIIAAGTTSLPEELGGERNWDYRFSWIRDSTLTLQALISVGHTRVATGFKKFIEVATAGRPNELQIMYGCHGERRLTEVELQSVAGYAHSRPARVGNDAATQTQLDVYGELLDAAHLWRRAGNPVAEDGWRFLRGIVDVVCDRWKERDRGLWESRGQPKDFVYSKVMCWLALERGIQAVEEVGLSADVDRWRQVRRAIRDDVEHNGLDPERGCFVQSYGSKELDASLLRLPMIGFVDACDERMLKTVQAIEKDLMVDGFLRRYRNDKSDDGLSGGEGTFLMCSFWLVDVLTMQGKIDDAEKLFDRLLGVGNELGLFAEEYDPHSRRLLGNFPQAFTHVALISAAQQIERYRRRGRSSAPLAERSHGMHRAGATWHHDAGDDRRREQHQSEQPHAGT